MKLRTSFFNTTVLRKDITRFAPVWGLYAIFQVLFVLLAWEGEGSAARFVTNAPAILQFMGMLNLLYAGLCAFLLFGDLFTARMCNALHALPLRREGWFLTHLAAGLLFCIVPNSIGALLAALLLQQYCYAAFIWLAVMVLQFLFFFGAGAFSIMCAGNRLGSIAVYAIFNFFAVLAAWLTVTFYEPMLYGVKLNISAFVNYSPTVAFTQSGYVDFEYDNMRSAANFLGFRGSEWQYLFVAAGVGVVLLGLAVLLYRRRNLESAGDFIAVRPVAPVFLVIYSLCAGAVMYFVAEVFSTGMRYIFLLIGLAIGYFTGRMLLERKVNVFRGKTVLGFGILVAAFIMSTVITLADPFGITRFVPEADRVEKVKISPYASAYYIENESCVLTAPEDIEKITAIHEAFTNDRPAEGDMVFSLHYTLKNGTVVQRQYPLDADSDAGETMRMFYSSADCVLGSSDIAQLCEQLTFLEFYSGTDELSNIYLTNGSSLPESNDLAQMYGFDDESGIVRQELFRDSETVKGLLTAILADCAAGDMAQQWDFHNNAETLGNITLAIYVSKYQTDYRDITVFADCKNTVAFLKAFAKQAQTS